VLFRSHKQKHPQYPDKFLKQRFHTMPHATKPTTNAVFTLHLNEPKKSYNELLDAIGDSQVVLIGDGTHGTREFYRERADITRRLITEKGFCVVAVEADWPDAYRVNRWVRSLPATEFQPQTTDFPAVALKLREG